MAQVYESNIENKQKNQIGKVLNQIIRDLYIISLDLEATDSRNWKEDIPSYGQGRLWEKYTQKKSWGSGNSKTKIRVQTNVEK